MRKENINVIVSREKVKYVELKVRKRILRILFLTQKQIHDKDQQNEKSYCPV